LLLAVSCCCSVLAAAPYCAMFLRRAAAQRQCCPIPAGNWPRSALPYLSALPACPALPCPAVMRSTWCSRTWTWCRCWCRCACLLVVPRVGCWGLPATACHCLPLPACLPTAPRSSGPAGKPPELALRPAFDCPSMSAAPLPNCAPQENYLNHRPKIAGDDAQRLRIIAKAAEGISAGDVATRAVRQYQNWSLMPFAGGWVGPGRNRGGWVGG
jgi:hypothetical protein